MLFLTRECALAIVVPVLFQGTVTSLFTTGQVSLFGDQPAQVLNEDPVGPLFQLAGAYRRLSRPSSTTLTGSILAH